MFSRNTSKKPEGLNNSKNNGLNTYVNTIGNKNISSKLANYKNYMLSEYKYKLCPSAASKGKVNILKWALNNGFEYGFGTCEAAINANSPECLKLVLNKMAVSNVAKDSIFSWTSNYVKNTYIMNSDSELKELIDYAKKKYPTNNAKFITIIECYITKTIKNAARTCSK